ncbi:MAG: cellulose biosynthesis cyclic di-GMP-binding regulatory protein BcsB [Acuticoccus sp.]
MLHCKSIALLAGSFATVAVALVAAPAADAQVAPFSLRGDTAAGSANAPDRQRRLAAEEAATVVPEGGATAATAPAPFDINNDGTVPAAAARPPAAEETVVGVSTTVSPLTAGRPAGPSIAIDAATATSQDDLAHRLERPSEDVREFRVGMPQNDAAVDGDALAIVNHPILPAGEMQIDGEIGYVDWSFYVSSQEAARGGTLTIGFTNSVVVLPEASRLDIVLNGRRVAQTAIDSPDRVKLVALPVSPGLLKAGRNTMRVSAEMRHRIDCSLDATYELWTRFDPRLTGLSFPDGRLPLMGLSDLPGVGFDVEGMTRIRIVQPGVASLASIDRSLRVAQAASLRGRFAQPTVEIAPLAAPQRATPGLLTVAVGTFDELYRAMPTLPAEAQGAPVAALVDNDRSGPVVYISGPNQSAVDQALALFDAPRGAAAPLTPAGAVALGGGDSVTLSEAGLRTLDFSGRRFATHFDVVLPADFYATAYGTATLYLDAAYGADVAEGSSLAVLVNGQQANSIDLTNHGTDVFQDYPIGLAMRNFHPGLNRVTLVAELRTKADAECLPGGTVPSRDRFALFASTRLAFADFARVGQIPNLAAFVTDGFPYGRNGEPVYVAVPGGTRESVGAAGTLCAHLAVNRGAALGTSVVAETGLYSDRGLIVVGPAGDVPREVLDATGAAGRVPDAWSSPATLGGAAAADTAGLDRYDAVLRRLQAQRAQDDAAATVPADAPDKAIADRERWFEELQQERDAGNIVSKWLGRVRDFLDIDDSAPPRDSELAQVKLSQRTSLILSQASAPQAPDAAWTLVTAPTGPLLSQSVTALGARHGWHDINGQTAGFEAQTGTVTTIQPRDVTYLATLPLTLGNVRLIAANWFSLNTGIYAVALIVVGIALGILTWLLFRPMGRHN